MGTATVHFLVGILPPSLPIVAPAQGGQRWRRAAISPAMLKSFPGAGSRRLLAAWGAASALTGWLWGFPQSVALCDLWELLSAPWEVPAVLCGLPGGGEGGQSGHWRTLALLCVLLGVAGQ